VSEQGRRDFLATEGLTDWVVLHGGATAVFPVSSLAEAARLAGAVAQLPGAGDVLMTVANEQLTVRLTRGLERIEPVHVELARAISAVAHRHGLAGDRSRVQEVQIAVAALPDTADVEFWRAALGYRPLAGDNAVDPLGHGSTVWIQELDPAKPLRHAMHLDVSVAREHVESRVAAAIAAGGRVVHHWPEPEAWTLTDRAGNRVCICAWPDGA
jgi:4a-hydroxytetrahydrobiopterin dehydratase